MNPYTIMLHLFRVTVKNSERTMKELFGVTPNKSNIRVQRFVIREKVII